MDGSGNLYMGGSFTIAGDAFATNIAKWNGSTWSALGSGINNTVRALAVSGGDLYVGGHFTTAGGITANRIAKWNGSSWSPLGAGVGAPPSYYNPGVSALAFLGGDLYAGGGFTTAGSIAATNIAKWNGANWSALGLGVNGGVSALAVSGTDVYAGGGFITAGGDAAKYIAKWNGTTWSPLGLGMNNSVTSLAIIGTNLYTGGYFTTAGGISANFIAKWNGNSWSALGLGMNNNVFALAASGSNLYVGGADFIVKWNESNSWAPLSSGIVGPRGGYPAVYALTVSGTNLYAGGEFTAAGSAAANYIAKWDGRVWSALGLGLARVGGDIPAVYELAASDTNLYAGGWFTRANGLTAKGIARWNGSNWSALGSGIDGPSTGLYPAVYALLPSGTSVYAAGYFTNAGGTAANAIAKWNGSSWSALGSGMERSDGAPTFVGALAMSGSDLYAGGSFITAGGNVASNIAKWNGSSWSALGSGLNGTVSALAGADGDLYAGGDFTRAGGIRANYIAKWNGNSWSALDSGMDLSVGALALSGTDLYAGGNFETAGGTPANHIAKWNGTSWSALGAGTSASVSALAVWGSDVYAGGSFTMAGAIAVHGIAKWNGSAWTALGSGMGGPPPGDSYPSVRALAVLGSDLYAGGLFTTAGGKVSAYVARACLVAPPGGIADSIMQSGGRANLKFYGNPGHGFDVQRTTSLNPPITWTTITTGPLSPAADGSFTFTDTDAPPGTAYYRVVER